MKPITTPGATSTQSAKRRVSRQRRGDPRSTAEQGHGVSDNPVWKSWYGPEHRRRVSRHGSMLLGYARVSTDDQILDLQRDALKEGTRIALQCARQSRAGVRKPTTKGRGNSSRHRTHSMMVVPIFDGDEGNQPSMPTSAAATNSGDGTVHRIPTQDAPRGLLAALRQVGCE